jgi:hypothetical protein
MNSTIEEKRQRIEDDRVKALAKLEREEEILNMLRDPYEERFMPSILILNIKDLVYKARPEHAA